MKKLILILTIFLLTIISFYLVSCNATVEFNVNFVVDGKIYSTLSTSGEEIISIPENPKKEGCTFIGWYWDEGSWQRPFTANSLLNEPLSSDMSVYAKWDELINETEPTPELSGVDIYSVVLNIEEDTLNAVFPNTTQTFSFLNDITVANGATYVVSKDIGCETIVASKTVSLVEGDNTYYVFVTNDNAQKLYTVTIRRRPIYTVEFNTNSDEKVETLHVEENNMVDMQTTSKRGYIFDGWTLSGKIVDFPYTIESDTIFNAKWIPIQYQIQYELYGGTNDVENTNNYTVEQIVTLKSPTREHYRFGGWFENKSFEGVPLTEIKQGTIDNITLYAKWTPVQYKIEYALNNGINNKNNVFTYNVEQEILLEQPTKYGYDFMGWFTESALVNKIEKIPIGTNGDIKVYAKWQASEKILYFDGCGATSGTMQSITVRTDETIKLPKNEFKKTGYKLKGWITEETNQYEYTDEDYFRVGGRSSYTLHAVWELEIYKITYNLNDGKNNTENLLSFTIEDLPIRLSYPTKNGYGFAGWFVEETFDSEVLEITTIGDVELYARWAEFKINWGQIYGVKDDVEKIVIPKFSDGVYINDIHAGALSDCTSLKEIIVDDDNKYFSCIEGNLYSKDGTKFYAYAIGKQENVFEVNNSVETISKFAFDRCTSLEQIIIPSSVTSIGNYAFHNCKTLKDIIIPESVTSIGESVFSGCASLQSVIIKGIVTAISEDAFSLCTELQSVTMPNGVISIGQDAFYGCKSLEQVNIPSSVTTINRSAFYGCATLQSITIPESVTFIGEYAFFGCSELSKVIIENENLIINDSVFSACPKVEIYFLESSKETNL